MNEGSPTDLPVAASWSLLTGQAGQFLIFAGLAVFCAALVLWIFQGKREGLGKLASALFVAGCFSIFGAFGCLATLFINNQFQFKYIYSHSGADTSLLYKIASVWTAQEGSFLLWATTSAVFGVLTLRGTGRYWRWYGAVYSTFLGVLCGILAYESPFNVMPEVVAHGKTFIPLDGAGMVPSLQNYWVIIHPPTIFTGFGSLTVLFAYAASAMLTGDAQEWVRRVRPWALLSTSILALGLCMGGMWAYETLGWGGFWQWDPVENVSFVPWLFCAALLHGLIVQNTKGRWTASNLILGALPFLTFVYGTFLTRSGLLDKVSNHSFVSMDKSALVILRSFMAVVAVAYFVLFFTKGRSLAKRESVDPDAGIHREAFYRFGVLLIGLFGTVIALGMSWPVITALRGGMGAAILEPTYHLVIAWFFIPIMLGMAIAPFVSWRTMKRTELWIRISSVLSVSAGLTGFAMLALTNPTIGVHLHGGETVHMPFGYRMNAVPWMAVLLFTCVFVGVANVWRVAEVVKRSKAATLGGFVAHLGFATLLAGLILSRGFEQTETNFLQIGETANFLDYKVTCKGRTHTSLTDRQSKVLFDVVGPQGQKFEARPGYYLYDDGPDHQKPQMWPHVEKGLTHDIYFSMAPPITDVWASPETFRPGESRTIDPEKFPITVTYVKPTMEGAFGQPGAKFGASLRIKTPNGEFAANPTLTITKDGLVPDLGPVGRDLRIVMTKMDAADKSATIQLLYATPVFQVDFFYKPLTSLVWIGTGILTLGGLMSAFARRFRSAPAVAASRAAGGSSSVDLRSLLESSGAIRRGHFLLTSGRHSDVYFEKFRVLEQPPVLSALCSEIASHYRDGGFDFVAGPTTGGIIIAFEVARHMGLPAVYVESENGVRTLRRGKQLTEGARGLIVDDVLTTGGSLVETRRAIESAGAVVSAYAVLIDRSPPGLDLGLPLHAAYKVEAESYAPDEVPASLAAIPITKPGTNPALA